MFDARKKITTAALLFSLMAGISTSAVAGYVPVEGPAEAWNYAVLAATKAWEIVKMKLFYANYSLAQKLYHDNIMSAIKVVTKQESLASNTISNAVRESGEQLVNAMKTQGTTQRIVNATIDFGAATGQGHNPCKTVAANQTLSASYDQVANRAWRTLQSVDIAPGTMRDPIKAQQARLDAHREKFCTESEAASGLCSKGSMPGGDTNAANLFIAASEQSDVREARKALIQNIAGAPDAMPARTAGATPAGQLYMHVKNRKDAMLSVPLYSLAVIDAENTRAAEFGNRSPVEAMRLKVNGYFGGQEAKRWSATLSRQRPRGLLVEAARMEGLSAWMSHKEYERGQRINTLLATLLITESETANAAVDASGNETVAQGMRAAIE